VNFLFTAVIALIGAFSGAIVYRWQKHIDVQSDDRANRQRVYEGFLGALRAAQHAALWDRTQAVRKAEEMNEKSDLIHLYSPENVAAAASETSTAFYDWRSSIDAEGAYSKEKFSTYMKAHATLSPLMRSDLFGERRTGEHKGIGAIIMKKIRRH